MKKIFNYILAVTALLAFAPIAKAQDDYTFQNGVGVRKTISAPNLNGEYFITLESFVEGKVDITTEMIPADIVLVLDVSSSMVRSNMGEAGEPEYVAISKNRDNVDGRVLTLTWTYGDYNDNLYIEYPYGSENFCHILTDGRRFYFTYNDTQYWLTGGGTSSNNGSGITGGTWNNNMANYGGEVARPSAVTTDIYGSSITTTRPAAAANNNTVIWRGPLYQRTNNFTRMHALENAVATFLNIVHQKCVDNKLDNRISIVKFSGLYVNDPEGENALKVGNHYSDTNGGATTEVFQGWTDASNQNEINKIIKDIKHIGTGHGTSQDFGLNLAQKLLASLGTDTEPRSKTVVLFTDGDPWRSNAAYGTYQADAAAIANLAISKSYDIKHTVAYTSVDYEGTEENHYTTVFTVGTLGTGEAPAQANNVMNYCSSKYPEAKSSSNTGTAAEGDYVFRAETAADLDKVFSAIANSSSESEISLDAEATTTVDIVSKSFMLPQGASTNVQIFTAKCNGGAYEERDGVTVFVPEFASPIRDYDLEDSVEIKQSTGSGKYDEVDVTGFDYSENFCGPVKDEDGHFIDFVGKKLIVKFPVKMDPEALGGPNAPTNAPGSGIFVEGQDDPVATFETPHVSLPYNIHITKTGLEKGESARFKIEKIIVQDTWITTAADGKQTINVPNNAVWDPMTTVMVTGDGSSTDPGIWVRGLPSTEAVGTEQKIVLYRVSEDEWSWSYDRQTGPMITDNSKIDNPFQFKNVKMNQQQIKIKVRHAESKARNIFKLNTEGGGVEYMDSKNDREKKAVK